MVIQSLEELNALLNRCKATPVSEVREGGNFYKVKSQLKRTSKRIFR